MRVLKPGGYIGVRDTYWSGRMVYRSEPCPVEGGAQRISPMQTRALSKTGADLDAGIKHRERLRRAGFQDVEIGLTPLIFTNDGRWQLRESPHPSLRDDVNQHIVDSGDITYEQLDRYERWLGGIRTDPGGVDVRVWVNATGRKPE